MGNDPLLIKLLFEKLAAAIDGHQSLDSRGFHKMSDYIGKKTGNHSIDNRYLYETYTRLNKNIKEGKKEVKIYVEKLDIISKALGYERFLHFTETILSPVDKQLAGCIGTWWSIVRANNGQYILKAPVKLSMKKDQSGILIELQGGQRVFNGTVTLRAGNIFCELDTGIDKKLYIVMKVGTSAHPRLLQGTFSGISTAGDPIAGRELFLREEKLKFEEMKWSKLDVDNNTLDSRINHYFSDYEKNCIKINNVSTFSMTDLDVRS
jgi:hypothetical protein